VYLRLQLYRQLSVAWHRNHKLSPRFYGPFTIIQKVGTIAYRLDLPEGTLLHPISHISQLKLKLGCSVEAISHLPPINAQGVIQPEPEEIPDRRSHRVHHRAVVELLVHWEG
jgi:hypothetical protein